MNSNAIHWSILAVYSTSRTPFSIVGSFSWWNSLCYFLHLGQWVAWWSRKRSFLFHLRPSPRFALSKPLPTRIILPHDFSFCARKGCSIGGYITSLLRSDPSILRSHVILASFDSSSSSAIKSTIFTDNVRHPDWRLISCLHFESWVVSHPFSLCFQVWKWPDRATIGSGGG